MGLRPLRICSLPARGTPADTRENSGEAGRPDPEKLLGDLKREEKRERRGQLKIFFGYAAGVGKTYTMLKTAHKLKAEGVDVVLGYVEPHSRPETMELIDGLEALPVRQLTHHGIRICEMDTDGILRRRPEAVLVDEYAHTNAPACRHRKRYQDVKELLEAGIDVYTTVNVQHLESLMDIVGAITGVVIRERIPDSAFELAAEVQLVDIEPVELIRRLREGKVYKKEQAQRALDHFFTEEKLTALREIALRRMADRVNRAAEREQLRAKSAYVTEEHILVGISAAPSSPKIIRAAARLAQAFGCPLTGLYVENVPRDQMPPEDRKRLEENLRLAEQLGAVTETVYGDDIPFLLAEYARTSGVSKIVAGRSHARRIFLWKASFTDRLALLAPGIDIYIIPAGRPAGRRRYTPPRKFSAPAFLKGMIALLFGIMAAVFLYVKEPAAVTFILAAALLAAILIWKMRLQERELARTAYRIRLLMDMNQRLQSERDAAGIGRVLSSRLGKILGRRVVFYGRENGRLGRAILCDEKGCEQQDPQLTGESERAVAEWVFLNRRRAGAGTDTLGNAACYYLAVRSQSEAFGVAGIELGQGKPLDPFEHNVVFAILAEAAIALERETLVTLHTGAEH